MATFDDIPGLKCRPHALHDPVLYATAVAAPRNTRSPKGLPVREPLGSMWHDSQQLKHVHPEALGSPSGYVVPSGHRLLRPHPRLWIPPRHLWIRGGGFCTQGIGLRWESRGSPIYSAGLCSRADSHTPVAPKSAHDCCFLFGFSLHLPVKGSGSRSPV